MMELAFHSKSLFCHAFWNPRELEERNMKQNSTLKSIGLILILLGVFIFPAYGDDAIIRPNETNTRESTHAHSSLIFEIPKDLEPAEPLPESEIITIIFSERWLNENNRESDPDIINITILKIAFDSQFSVDQMGRFIEIRLRDDEPVVVFRMPKEMFFSFNPNPDVIRLMFPKDQFKYYKNFNSINGKDVFGFISPRENSYLNTESFSNEMVYNDVIYPQNCSWRAQFHPFDNRTNITYTTGKIRPEVYSFDGDRFIAYQEVENYYNNDVVIEIVASYSSDSYDGAPIKIFPVIYNEDGDKAIFPWPTPSNPEHLEGAGCYLEAPYVLLPRNYEWYIKINLGQSLGLYQMWLHDPYNDQWFYYYYQDNHNPCTALLTSECSSELGLDDDGTAYMDARTSPVREEWCVQNNDGYFLHPDECFYQNATFEFTSPNPPNWPPYVWIGYNWDNHGWNGFPSCLIT